MVDDPDDDLKPPGAFGAKEPEDFGCMPLVVAAIIAWAVIYYVVTRLF